MSGIQAEEIDDTDLDLVISIATEWFTEQTGIAYVVASTDAAYDNAVMYYSCYLASIAQNGMGIEQLRIGDIFISYVDEEPYQRFLELANEAIISKQALSIKTSTYNADSAKGSVDWKKNIDGSDSTLNVRQTPRGM
jgi:PDZ domain-containing secreted protein